ncbi:fimbrial protein [Salmonella enterica]|nr:fimbrial protein [Salmonella enterica]EGA6653344.1 fimbrial protein [Salmonella enterica]EKI3359863.1 fimbrial protein [Salmonella enterica]
MNNVTIFACCLAATTMLAVLPGGGSSARAADLTLPALPAGCQYTRQSLLPVQGTFRVEPGTPLYGVVGPQQTTFLQVSLRCDTPLSTPLTLALKGSGNLNWQGPGRDVLPTAVRDTGLRMYAQGEAAGGACSPGGWLGAGSGDWQCTLPAGGNGAQTLSLQVAAQVVKTGENTPVLSARALQPEAGDIQLQVNGSPVPLTGAGVIAPKLVTPVTCTIEKGRNDTVNFGDMTRDFVSDGDYTRMGVGLASQSQNIQVYCTPQPDDASPYSVSLTFRGDISDTYNFAWAQYGALKTSIPELFILPTNAGTGASVPLNGDSVPLSLDSATQRYNLTVNWMLTAYSKTGKAPEKYGAITATATYTVEVN